MKQKLISIVVFLGLNLGASVEAQEGTFARPKIGDIAVYGDENTTIRRVVFSYASGAEQVVGTKTSVYFKVARPVKDVWPVFQDFNLWQNDAGYFVTGPFGDNEGELEFLFSGPRGEVSIDNTQPQIVQQLVPEAHIVLHSPPREGIDAEGGRLGYRHEGKSVFMLTEVNGATVVTASMEHLFRYYGAEAKGNANKAYLQKIEVSQDRKRKGMKDIWETGFIPELRELLEGVE